MSEFLRTETFEAWAKGFDGRLAEALAVRAKVDATAEDVAVLKDRSERSYRLAVSSVVASAISVVGNLLVKAFGH
jgi:hypothetical protein